MKLVFLKNKTTANTWPRSSSLIKVRIYHLIDKLVQLTLTRDEFIANVEPPSQLLYKLKSKLN